MEIINEEGSVQSIPRENGYEFFVESDIEDDIFIVFIEDICEEKARDFAIVMSLAWDAATKYCYENS